MPEDERTDNQTPEAAESKYLLLVGGLLLIISMALGWLWLMERSRRITIERQAAQMRRELDGLRAQVDALKGLPRQLVLPTASQPTTRPRH